METKTVNSELEKLLAEVIEQSFKNDANKTCCCDEEEDYLPCDCDEPTVMFADCTFNITFNIVLTDREDSE